VSTPFRERRPPGGQTPFARVLPPVPQGFTEPFWYGSLQSFWLYYLADPEAVARRLPHGLEVALFEVDGERRALASLDFQAYTGHGPGFLEYVHEVEFNVYAYPSARNPGVPMLTWEEFLAGQDQTKSVGGYRLHVPCDNPNAIRAGKALYGEPKYLAQFTYSMPTLNDPSVVTWDYSVFQDDAGKPGTLVYSVEADLRGLTPLAANPSPLTEYGTLEHDGRLHVIANQWSFYGPFETYPLGGEGAGRVSLGLGPSPDPRGVIGDLRELIGGAPPVAAQTFTSPPVASECRGWFPVPA
jgi:Acetoacetate decarboxylase (ADC)